MPHTTTNSDSKIRRALIVEPEKQIALLLEHILKRELKYEVKTLKTGEEALLELGDAYLMTPFPYSLMFTDIGERHNEEKVLEINNLNKKLSVLKNRRLYDQDESPIFMSGYSLASHVYSIIPELPVILSIGTSHNPSRKLPPNVHTIPHPFNASDFIRTVHKIENKS